MSGWNDLDAMFPKVAIKPKEIVEADLGPVIGEDDQTPGNIYWVPEGTDVRDFKPTNPKDAIGSNKLPLHLVPSVLNIYASLAFLEGALKYGTGNYRAIGVRMSVYLAALERHLQKVKDGEWADQKTGVPHFSSILACVGIILDAKHCGKLTDDRLPAVPTADVIEAMEVYVPLLKQQFADCHPRHYTIADTKEPE